MFCCTFQYHVQIDLNLVDSQLIDLDPSTDHSALGANATLAVSLSASLATAHSQNKSLARYFAADAPLLIPMPMVNILSGGAHANRSMDIQDILIIPTGAKTFTQALSWIVAVREMAAVMGKESGQVTNLIADEGGLSLTFSSIEKACEFVIGAIEKVGLQVGNQVSLALDIAATQFYDGEKYNLATIDKSYSPTEFVKYISQLTSNQPIISIEDPFAEDDWSSWQQFMEIAPAELGWGTHEKTLPQNAYEHPSGPKNQICIAQPGAKTWVRSWVPNMSLKFTVASLTKTTL